MIKKKSSFLILGIISFLLVITVGYALFSETLNIKGTASTNGEFNVEIFSTEITEIGSTNATANIADDKNTLTLSAPNLQYPGATVEYKITVKNTGSLAAKLKNINKSNDDGVIKMTYAGIAENDIIAIGDTKTFTVTITWDGDSTEMSSMNYSMDLIFEQSI